MHISPKISHFWLCSVLIYTEIKHKSGAIVLMALLHHWIPTFCRFAVHVEGTGKLEIKMSMNGERFILLIHIAKFLGSPVKPIANDKNVEPANINAIMHDVLVAPNNDSLKVFLLSVP